MSTPGTAVPKPSLGPDALAGRHLLIVDRNPTVRTYLRTQLSDLGIGGVQGATSAADALRLVQGNSFDIILCEYQLEEGQDGQQLLEELRGKRLICPSTVFIVITAERGSANVTSVAELAPDDYLIKPFTADQLQARLLRALQRKQALTPIYRRRQAGQPDAALAACDRVLRDQPALLFEVLRLKGELLEESGRHDEAQRIYRAALEKRPLPWASMGLARSLAALGDEAEAARIAAEVVAQFPRYLAAYDFLARLHEQAGCAPRETWRCVAASWRPPSRPTSGC
jgi:CheY-like chemotaxis protein